MALTSAELKERIADILKDADLETTSAIVGRKSYNNLKTTHYGLIDWPVSPNKDKGKFIYLKSWGD